MTPTMRLAETYGGISNFGLIYDQTESHASRSDIDFYVGEALRAGGRVLELGCGTGRVLLPTARAGVRIDGIDDSLDMLARCKAKLSQERSETRGGVVLRRGDIRDFEFNTTYQAVTAPFHVFQHLLSPDDQMACLGVVARHLRRGGHLVFDVFNPCFAALVSSHGEERQDMPEEVLTDGRVLRRTMRIVGVRWTEQISEVELTHHVSPRVGADAVRYVQSFEHRWYLRAELVHLLDRCGFQVDAIFGDFDGSPLGDASPAQIVRARKR